MSKASPYFVFVVFLLISATSCNKDPLPPDIPVATGVYICNEGNFNFGNGDISFYDPLKQEITNGLFSAANQYSLGDVAQSFCIWDSLGFIVVNNSQKIEVVKVPSMEKIHTISIAGSSPRYIYPINDSIAYVSELYKSKIYIINYISGTFVSQIQQVSRWTEHFVEHGNDLLVEERNLDAFPSDSAGFVKINVANHTVVQRYSFPGTNINGLVTDRNNRVWLLMQEDTTHGIRSSLVCLNPDLSFNRRLEFPNGHSPRTLCINGAGDQLFYLDKDVYSFSISQAQLSSSYFISGTGLNIYAMNVEPVTGEVYLSDALDFVQASRVYRYDKNGQPVHTFTAGVISGNFTFRTQ